MRNFLCCFVRGVLVPFDGKRYHQNHLHVASVGKLRSSELSGRRKIKPFQPPAPGTRSFGVSLSAFSEIAALFAIVVSETLQAFPRHPKSRLLGGLADAERAADAQNRRRLDAVQTTDGRDCGAVLDGQGSERISRADLVVTHGGLFGSLLLVLLLVGDLIVEILPGIGVDAEEGFFQQEGFAAQDAVLEVDQPFGVESLPVVAGFEMQVRACRATRRAAQSDDVPGLDPLVRFHEPLREVAVVGSRSERWP